MTDASEHRGFTGLGRGDIVRPEELTGIDDYLGAVLGAVGPNDPIELRSSDALGLVLADDVTSHEPLPAFANASMDGYAVVAEDVGAAREDAPVVLKVVGEVPAGATDPPSISPGYAARIMTGAPVPTGADAVVPVEVTREEGGTVAVHRAAHAGEFVRTVGQDVTPGDRLLRAGHRIRPADIGLLSAAGIHRVTCHPAPRVVILSTGDELVPAERRPGTGQIRNSNGPMLAALCRQADAIPYSAGIVPDDRKALAYAFDSNRGHADLFVATGGVSAGAYDHLHDVIAQLGEVDSYRLAMQPGMPQLFGHIGEVPVFGLPGNPVSAFVSFELFVRPAIRSLQARRDVARPSVTAVLAEDVTSPPHKRSYLRVRLSREDGHWSARLTGEQGSHLLTSISQADGLAEIAEDVTEAHAGDRVRVHLLVDG